MADPNPITTKMSQLAAEGIHRASGDEGSMQVMSADDMIKLDAYLETKANIKKNGICSQIRLCRNVRPGTV